MRHLNYNHLLYFWTVAREGSVAKASEVLHLTPQTISGQLKVLEDMIGEPLFQRVGRGLVITETGRLVEQYADEIFSLGAELAQRVKTKRPGMPINFNVGIVNSIPKLIAYKILEPALNMSESIRLVCIEKDLDTLLADLSVHKLDLILSDRQIPTQLNVRAYNHELGSSHISFFGKAGLRDQFEQSFPQCLNGAPMLLPTKEHAQRRLLDDWFDQSGIQPNIVAEFDDSALIKVFGEAGAGFFPAPSAMSNQIMRMYDVEHVGELEQFAERYFVISPERKIKHPALAAITEAARFSLRALDLQAGDGRAQTA